MASHDEREYLEPDGLGGFASGTASLIRTRRYHALLLTAARPPAGRMVLVNGFDAWADVDGRRYALSSQRYAPGVVDHDGASRVASFTHEPWPAWQFDLAPGVRILHEIVVARGQPAAIVTWRIVQAPAEAAVRLVVRPLLSGRDYHSLHRENADCRTDAAVDGDLVAWRPYEGVPGIVSRSNGLYAHDPVWYRNFLYVAERERGLDDREDLWSPGTIAFDLSARDALWRLSADHEAAPPDPRAPIQDVLEDERRRRAAFSSALERAADAYLVRRGDGATVIAGYPWFADWGRDTFIALRGLCLATGRLDLARQVLLEWAATVSRGMLPNRFAEGGEAPEFNAVDASLWFVIAAHELLEASEVAGAALERHDRHRLLAAVTAILDGYAAGTRYGIRLDEDGLIACGEPGLQLTWMDARVGNDPITPRIGKPVEVQALWLAALAGASRRDARWQVPWARGRGAFARRFWNPGGQYLHDVVDVDHVAGRVDARFRPNQILAVGGLGQSLLDPHRTRLVLDAVERRLLTPMGLQTLARDEPGYVGHYTGGAGQRDAAYHQGTVWPWLLGPFVQAWLAARADTGQARQQARRRFVDPIESHLREAGLGHVSEIADAEPPFTPRGCPFQAWSLGELIRMRSMTAAPDGPKPAAAAPR